MRLPSNDAQLPAAPAGWLTFCNSRELGAQPLKRQLLGEHLVAFRTENGEVGVVSASCAHMGADLAQGKVVGEAIQCPFHQWEFGTDGRCSRIPAQPGFPPSACQTAYPAVERHGCVFFYNGPPTDYPLPFFDDCTSDSLCRAQPFTLELECPWYMVGANGVDVQHFQGTHDRVLLGSPHTEFPHPLVHRSEMRFGIAGRGLRDRMTRRFAGKEVTMRVTDWSGTLFFVQATFPGAQSYGMVGLLPLEAQRTLVFVTVMVRRSRGRIGQVLRDPPNAAIRRLFIRNFLLADVERSAGTDFDPTRLIAADHLMLEYFDWLREAQEILVRAEDHGVARLADHQKTIHRAPTTPKLTTSIPGGPLT